MDKEKSSLHLKLVLKYFWKIVKRHKTSFFLTVIFTIAFSVLDVYVPLQYLKLWNVVSKNDFSLVDSAKYLILVILVLKLTGFFFRRISGFALVRLESSVMAGLREQAFSYMIGHSHTFFANNFGGSLTQKINKYARAFEKLMDRIVMDGLPLIVRGVGTVIAVYSLFPKYAIILGVFCVVFLLTALFYMRFKLKYDISSALSDTKTVGAFADSITNHSSIQLFAGHYFERKKVAGVIEEQRKATSFNWYLWEGLTTLQSFYIVVVEFLIFWIAIGDWKLGLMTLPIMVLLQNYLVRLVDNLWSFAGIVRQFHDSFADAQEMALIMEEPYEIRDFSKTKIENAKGEVVFEGVTYVYKNNNSMVLDNFSINIPAGQKIAIVGTSGAGKTTFVRLLMRIFDVSVGKISIDGTNIKDITQQNLHEQIAFVPQDPVLFHRTLLENIRYGKRDATDEEVYRAAYLAHCDKFIEDLPNKYKTYVGERGVKLSGGERQRVAIARAILKNAPILILDEATSSLDSVSESYIQDALAELMKGKTAIVIAHRLSTIQKMDRIIVLDKGKITEEGTHSELINKNGLYAKLWNRQAGGFLK